MLQTYSGIKNIRSTLIKLILFIHIFIIFESVVFKLDVKKFTVPYRIFDGWATFKQVYEETNYSLCQKFDSSLS